MFFIFRVKSGTSWIQGLLGEFQVISIACYGTIIFSSILPYMKMKTTSTVTTMHPLSMSLIDGGGSDMRPWKAPIHGEEIQPKSNSKELWTCKASIHGDGSEI